MITDPTLRGRALGAFFLQLEPALWADVLASGLLPAGGGPQARAEWACFALHACVRGLVAAGGFGADGRRAVDALHAEVAAARDAAPDTDGAAAWGERLAARYAAYGELARAHAARGEAAVSATLGAEAARRLTGAGLPGDELGRMLGDLYDAISQGAAESVRGADA